jgi:ribosome-associated heat shock protein Hsp15
LLWLGERHQIWLREMDDAGRVRIDKWLWAARFFKTRSLALTAIELGRVRVCGERIKPAREMHIGDRVELRQGDHRIELIVRQLSATRGPAAIARTYYEETAASLQRREQQAQARRYGVEPAMGLHGRPTKRDRRKLAQL